MKQPPPSHPLERWTIFLIVLALAAGKALPSLLAAWETDLYSRGAILAFGIWCLPLVAAGLKSRLSPNRIFLTAGIIALVVGSVAEVNAVKHLSLAITITAALPIRFSPYIMLAASVCWIPAAGWFLSHLIQEGLGGWERPTLAAMSLLILFPLALPCFSRPQPQQTPTS